MIMEVMMDLEIIETKLAAVKQKLQAVRFSEKSNLEYTNSQNEVLLAVFSEKKKTFQSLEQNTKNQAKLYEYAEALRNVQAQQNIDSQYILAYEAQVCRSLHHSETWSTQLQIMKRELDDLSRLYYECLTNVQKGKIHTESQLTSSILKLKVEADAQAEKYGRVLREQEQCISKLRHTIFGHGEEEEDAKNEDQSGLFISFQTSSMVMSALSMVARNAKQEVETKSSQRNAPSFRSNNVVDKRAIYPAGMHDIKEEPPQPKTWIAKGA